MVYHGDSPRPPDSSDPDFPRSLNIVIVIITKKFKVLNRGSGFPSQDIS
jgi:hypothetical protein